MSVKRVADPAGIDADMVHVDLTGDFGEAERNAIMEIFDAGEAAPRIDRLRKFPSLASRVAWLDRRLAEGREDRGFHERLRDAESLAYKLAARPALVRDQRRQAGTRKPRKVTIPAWHADAIRHAKTLLASGRETHELTGLCARRFDMSTDAVRPVLQSAGLVQKRKNRAQ